MSDELVEIKEFPRSLNLEWTDPPVAEGRHLSMDFIPMTEFSAMRKRIGGRQAFMPKTNFTPDALEELKKNPVMESFKGGYVFSSFSTEPETLLFLQQVMEMFRPRVVLELGSGLSTLILSAAHKKILKADKADGAYVALEQSQGLMDKVLEFAKIAKVEKNFTPLVLPMVKYKIGDMFDTDEKGMPCFNFDEKKLHKALGGVRPDMVFIDGPADDKTISGASFAKMLTMPILSLYAAPGAAVFMDGVYGDTDLFAMEQWHKSGSANVIGVKAVGKGLMVGLANG